MSTNLKTQQVDARFFGAHDKAWVPVKECYLYSKSSPQLFNKKRSDLDEAFLEAEGYIKKIRQKYGNFCYAPDKTPFIPEMYDKQLQSLIPNYKEEKPVKKKKKGEQAPEENGENEKSPQGEKKIEHGVAHRLKLKRSLPEESSKLDGDVCLMNYDYVSEEKISNDGLICPEDEIARRLEMYDTHRKGEGENADENSTDLDEDVSLPIPEHAYSRRVENLNTVQSSSSALGIDDNESSECIEEDGKKDIYKESNHAQNSDENSDDVKDAENECVTESSDVVKSNKEENVEPIVSPKANNEHCEVSSTSADLKIMDNEDHDDISDPTELDLGRELDSSTAENNSKEKSKPAQNINHSTLEKLPNGEAIKKDEDRLPKSFVNLSCDQKQKILNEAKLLANIDEMTALGKQKVLNELGLDASNVDIQQLAEENRQILETLNRKCQNQNKELEEITIKNEDFDPYLMEKNSEENTFEDDLLHASPKLGSIKVKDFNSLSKQKTNSSATKGTPEPILKIMDVQSLRDLKQIANEPKLKRKSFEDNIHSKKLKLEPVVELIKLDGYNKSVEKLNRKLRLSDEVSLLMVDGEKKVNVEVDSMKPEAKKLTKKVVKAPRARKSMPNRAKRSSSDLTRTSSKNISVISVDTENSAAQKNLLKSLRLEEKKPDDTGKKTVLITTNEKGIKNVDVKNTCEPIGKKQIKEVTIEAVKDAGKGNDQAKDASALPQKNLAVVANSHLIVTNQNNQSNLALAQNNLGQLSLVHLSNLTSGIQTNFVNLTNETIGFNNSIGALYASPNFNSDFPVSSATNSVILTPSLTASLPNPVTNNGNATTKGGKPNTEATKLPINRINSTKTTSGISVKSPASLGLITPQPTKLPPLIAIPGEGVSVGGEVGSVTAELNKHSIKVNFENSYKKFSRLNLIFLEISCKFYRNYFIEKRKSII